MLAIGREKAQSQGLQNIIEFREGDAELLDLPNSSFNAAFCRWGLMFMPNVSNALDIIDRSLVSGVDSQLLFGMSQQKFLLSICL